MAKKQIKKQENIITTEKIKQFLKEELNWDWNGEVFDRKIDQKRKAYNYDFKQAAMIYFKIGEKEANYFANLKISEDTFKYVFAMQEGDLSASWQDFLAKKEDVKTI